MPKDYSKMGQKWRNGIANNSQSYIDGINGVTDNPMAKAAANVDTAIQRYTAALRSGSWAQSLQASNFQNWKTVTAGVGATNWVNGAAKGGPKMDNYAAKAGAAYNQIRATVRAMPNATKAQRNARRDKAQEMMEAMKGIARR